MLTTYLKMLPGWAIKLIPKALFGVMRVCLTDCAEEGKLAGDFFSGKKAMRPLVFSHGLSGSKDMYQGLYKDWACHGYLVVALDHHDRSCIYTKKNGEPVPYLKELFYTK